MSDTSVFMSTVKPEPVQTPERPALSEEEVGRKSKSIIDEFLHINDYKVLRFTGDARMKDVNYNSVNASPSNELKIQVVR